MKITRTQLRRIIKESLIFEGVLYVTRSNYGITVEDDNGNYISVGDMVLNLIDSGETAFFKSAQGIDEKSLQSLIGRHEEGVQGGMQNWDADVFEDYYNVDNDKVLSLYANSNLHRVAEVEDLPHEDDGTNEFEEYYS